MQPSTSLKEREEAFYYDPFIVPHFIYSDIPNTTKDIGRLANALSEFSTADLFEAKIHEDMDFKLFPNQFLHTTHLPMLHIYKNLPKSQQKPHSLKLFFPTSVMQLGKISRARNLQNQTRVSSKSISLETLERFSFPQSEINTTNKEFSKSLKGKSLYNKHPEFLKEVGKEYTIQE